MQTNIQAAGKFSVPTSGLNSRLSAYASDTYLTAIAKEADQKHEDMAPLLDVVLAMLPMSNDEIMGFVACQSALLAKAANAVCEGFVEKKIPVHRITVCDRRYVKVDSSPSYYDVVTNKDQSPGPNFMPTEVVSYSLGAVYASILRQRAAEATRKSIGK